MFFRVLVFIFDLSQSVRNGKTIWKVYKLVASLEGYCSWTHVRPCVLANIELTIPLPFPGICCPHRGAVFSYTWRFQNFPFESDDRVACNVFFVWELLRPLLKGIPLYIIPDSVIYDPYLLLKFLKKNGITRVLFTPSLLGKWFHQSPDDKLGWGRGKYAVAQLLTLIRKWHRLLFTSWWDKYYGLTLVHFNDVVKIKDTSTV